MYTVYKLEEDLSPSGMPYIGFSENLYKRAYTHRSRLSLSYTPNLIPIQEFLTEKEARKFENDLREANGWEREGYAGGKSQGKKNVESGLIQALGKSGSGGKASGKKNVESGEWKKRQSSGGKMLWVHKNGIQTRCHPEKLQDYLDIGYIRGRLNNKS